MKFKKPAFSLIELLITISIMALLTTSGFNAYSKNREKQAIRSATTNLTSLLDSTRQLALVGNQPSDCTGSLLGYKLSTTINTNSITTTPICSTLNGASTTHSIDNITFTSSINITYKTLVGGVDLGGVSSLNLDYLDTNSQTHRIIINQSGDYSYEGII